MDVTLLPMLISCLKRFVDWSMGYNCNGICTKVNRNLNFGLKSGFAYLIPHENILLCTLPFRYIYIAFADFSDIGENGLIFVFRNMYVFSWYLDNVL